MIDENLFDYLLRCYQRMELEITFFGAEELAKEARCTVEQADEFLKSIGE